MRNEGAAVELELEPRSTLTRVPAPRTTATGSWQSVSARESTGGAPGQGAFDGEASGHSSYLLDLLLSWT